MAQKGKSDPSQWLKLDGGRLSETLYGLGCVT